MDFSEQGTARQMLCKVLEVTLYFWIAYVLMRPPCASIGDFLIQAPADGGLGVNMGLVNGIFFACIVAQLLFLPISHVDPPTAREEQDARAHWRRAGSDSPAISSE